MKTNPARRPQAERRRDTQRKLTNAVVRCLDQLGYAQTSITAVQEAAGVSRGAVLHHFPSKLELIAGTAKVLLTQALERTQDAEPWRGATSVEELVVHYWRTVVDTPAGRAYLEILGACRTDEELRAAVQEVVEEWESGLTSAALERFIGRPMPTKPDDVVALWGMCRSFLRGLLLDMSVDSQRSEQQVRLFARLLSTHLRLRDE
ncbi:MAG: TetR/AcrR family transcriptional regulator [Myxococcota bacterium]